MSLWGNLVYHNNWCENLGAFCMATGQATEIRIKKKMKSIILWCVLYFQWKSNPFFEHYQINSVLHWCLTFRYKARFYLNHHVPSQSFTHPNIDSVFNYFKNLTNIIIHLVAEKSLWLLSDWNMSVRALHHPSFKKSITRSENSWGFSEWTQCPLSATNLILACGNSWNICG